MVTQQYSKTVLSIGKYIRLSPYKVRRVLDQVRGKSYKEAMLILEFLPYQCTKVVQNILKSAAANANHKYNLETQDLSVKETFASQGPVLKRIQPRAKGKAFAIRKPTCHIFIRLVSKN